MLNYIVGFIFTFAGVSRGKLLGKMDLIKQPPQLA